MDVGPHWVGVWKQPNGTILEINPSKIKYSGCTFDIYPVSSTVFYNKDGDLYWYYVVTKEGELEILKYNSGHCTATPQQNGNYLQSNGQTVIEINDNTIQYRGKSFEYTALSNTVKYHRIPYQNLWWYYFEKNNGELDIICVTSYSCRARLLEQAPSTEIAHSVEIGWETSHIAPPARCFKQSLQLKFEKAICALLLDLREVPPGRPDLFLADEDDVDSLISRCEHTLSQMATHGSAKVRQMVELLTHDEALVILAYTCEDPYPVYRWLNAWLVQDRRDPLVKSSVGPFFRLLYQGLEKLPQKTVEAGRGVLVRSFPVLQKCFNSPPSVGASISFWGVSSFSMEDNVASQFGGGIGEEAIFYSCGKLQCVLLGSFSMSPREAEVLPLPPAVFEVHSTFRVSDKKLVISLDHDQAAHTRFSYVSPSQRP